MSSRTRSRLVFVALLAVIVAVTAASASATNRVVGNCTKSQVRPATVIIFCGDANAEFTHLHWTSFGGAVAHATGDYTVNNCTPNCAAGHFRSYPVAVIFSAPKRCPDGHHDYQQADAAFSSSDRPSGAAGGSGKPGKQSLSCPIP